MTRRDSTDALFRPLTVEVPFLMLGRRFEQEPDRIALNLSRDGGKFAVYVSPGHLCKILDIDIEIFFEVLVVKPWSAYLEMRTVDGKPHNLNASDLRDGGRIRATISASPVEECAACVLRTESSPKAGIKLSTMLEVLSSTFGLSLDDIESKGGKDLPQWLDDSDVFEAGFSELREDWLVKMHSAQTPLERAVSVVIAPEKRGGADRTRTAALTDIVTKLADASPRLGAKPLTRDNIRRILEASPHFSANGDSFGLRDDEDSKPVSNAETPAGNTRERKYGRTLKVVDELSKVNDDVLRLSRDKALLAEDLGFGPNGAQGSRPDEAAQLLQALGSVDRVTTRLEEEVKTVIRDAAVEKSRGQTWQTSLDSYHDRLLELLRFLEAPAGRDVQEVVNRLTQARHAMRDFQRNMLNDVSMALGESDNSTGQEPLATRRKAQRGEGPHSSINIDTVEVNIPDIYEVRASDGVWFPANIRRVRSNGCMQVDLFGDGVAVLYPNVKLIDVREKLGARDGKAAVRSRSRDGKGRAPSRSRDGKGGGRSMSRDGGGKGYGRSRSRDGKGCGRSRSRGRGGGRGNDAAYDGGKGRRGSFSQQHWKR